MPDLRNRSDHADQLVRFWGARLAARRSELRLSQAALADILGTSPYMISRYENGHAEPRIGTKVQLAEALESTCEALFPWRP